VFHKGFFIRAWFFAQDIGVICLAWLLSYYLRFSGWPVPVFAAVPPVQEYVGVMAIIPFVWGAVAWHFGLYRAEATRSSGSVTWRRFKAALLLTAVMLAVSFLLKRFLYSRLAFFYFGLFSAIGLALSRAGFLWALGLLRRRGWSLHRTLIIGENRAAAEISRAIARHPELCIEVVGVLEPHLDDPSSGADIAAAIRSKNADEVFVLLPAEGKTRLTRILQALETETVDIRIVPDILDVPALGSGIEVIDGHYFINIRDIPLDAREMIAKRIFDVALAALGIVITSPVMLFIAILVKLSSPGPVFYVQERMGLDGKKFRMLKFRTMKADAEEKGQPVWATRDDPRCTALGRVLRRLSLDELPQLFNVLAGQMSLVGPRPERPYFVERFKRRIPGYMLRHKMKAGMTGWAQVNGWRGDTDLGKRIECDLHYIQNWSLGFDFRILLLTILRAFKGGADR